MKLFGDIINQNRLCFELGQKSVDDAVIDARQQFANLRAIQYATYFPNDWLADNERYVAIEKQPQRLAGWAVTVGDSLNEEITVKNDTGE